MKKYLSKIQLTERKPSRGGDGLEWGDLFFMNDHFPQDAETYRKWKQALEKRGISPLEAAAQYEQMGFASYARKLRELIEKMEAAL